MQLYYFYLELVAGRLGTGSGCGCGGFENRMFEFPNRPPPPNSNGTGFDGGKLNSDGGWAGSAAGAGAGVCAGAGGGASVGAATGATVGA